MHRHMHRDMHRHMVAGSAGVVLHQLTRLVLLHLVLYEGLQGIVAGALSL